MFGIGSAPIRNAFIVQEKIASTGIDPRVLFVTESVFLLLSKDSSFVQNSLLHNSANVKAQVIHVTNFGSCLVLENEVKFLQSETPSHQAAVIVCKVTQERQLNDQF